MKNIQSLIYTGSFFIVTVSINLPKNNQHIKLKYDSMPIYTTNFNMVTNPSSFEDACDACIKLLRKVQCTSTFPNTPAVDYSGNDDFHRTIILLCDYINTIKEKHYLGANFPQMGVSSRLITETNVWVGVSITPSCDTTLFTFEHSSGIG